MTRSPLITIAGVAIALAGGLLASPQIFAQAPPDRAAPAQTPQIPPGAAPEIADDGMASGKPGESMNMMGPGRMQMMTKMMREMHDKVMHGGMVTQPKGDQGPASLAFHGIAARMHQDMDITYTGRADLDFVKGMIPHHQAAIDMAKIEFTFGKDPEIRKIAENLIKAQEAEVASLQQWLKQQGGQQTRSTGARTGLKRSCRISLPSARHRPTTPERPA